MSKLIVRLIFFGIIFTAINSANCDSDTEKMVIHISVAIPVLHLVARVTMQQLKNLKTQMALFIMS